MNAHRHDFTAAVGHNGSPCPVCTDTEDDEALIARLARDLWNNRPGVRLDDTPWEKVSLYWEDAFTAYARASLQCMRRLV